MVMILSVKKILSNFISRLPSLKTEDMRCLSLPRWNPRYCRLIAFCSARLHTQQAFWHVHVIMPGNHRPSLLKRMIRGFDLNEKHSLEFRGMSPLLAHTCAIIGEATSYNKQKTHCHWEILFILIFEQIINTTTFRVMPVVKCLATLAYIISAISATVAE